MSVGHKSEHSEHIEKEKARGSHRNQGEWHLDPDLSLHNVKRKTFDIVRKHGCPASAGQQ